MGFTPFRIGGLALVTDGNEGSVSTHRQALSALLFLYKEVLGQDLPWMVEIGRSVPTRRIPTVLTVAEVGSLLGLMHEQQAAAFAAVSNGLFRTSLRG